MLKPGNIVLAVAVLAAAWAIPGNAAEQQNQASPKPQDSQALALTQVKQLLPLADSDGSGRVSKQEWMKFMKAEFDRLDRNKSGVVDLKDVAPPAARTRRPPDLGR